MVAAQFAQALCLTLGLHTLCCHLKVQFPTQTNDCCNDCSITRILFQVPDKALINLDVIDRKLLQVGQ
jgi:uncharacterized protein (DUF2237 family)